jgi:FtsX-like permease family
VYLQKLELARNPRLSRQQARSLFNSLLFPPPEPKARPNERPTTTTPRRETSASSRDWVPASTSSAEPLQHGARLREVHPRKCFVTKHFFAAAFLSRFREQFGDSHRALTLEQMPADGREGTAVRLALGARPSQLLVLTVGQAARLGAIGVGIGLLAAVPFLALLLHGQRYGIQSIDPATFISVPAALLPVSALAALVPACKAMRIDPVEALRLD